MGCCRPLVDLLRALTIIAGAAAKSVAGIRKSCSADALGALHAPHGLYGGLRGSAFGRAAPVDGTFDPVQFTARGSKALAVLINANHRRPS